MSNSTDLQVCSAQPDNHKIEWSMENNLLSHVNISRVIKPARYTGGEWNSIVKDWNQIPVKVALAYPDLYEIGMSNLAIPILYDILNRQPDVLAERVFTP